MPQIRINADINLGQLLTAATLLIAGGIAWGNLTTIQASQANEMASINDSVTSLERDKVTTEARLTRIETLIEGQDTKLDQLLAALSN